MVVFVFVLLSSCMLCWLERWRLSEVYISQSLSSKRLSRVGFYYFFAVAIILFFAVCRADTVGGDLANYKKTFNFATQGVFFTREPAYGFLEYITTRLTGNFNVFLAICAGLTLPPMLYVLYKENTDYLWLGMLVFIAEAYASSFSLLRGSLSYACLYLSYHFRGRRRFAYFLFLLLAFLFHFSSLVLVLIFLIMDKKFSMYWYMFAGLVTLLLTQIKPVIVFVATIYITKYTKYFLMAEQFHSYVPALNFFLFGALAVLCWMYRDKLLKRSPKNALLINLSVAGLCVTVGLNWFSMAIRIVQMLRYFCVFIIPEIIACEENKTYQRLLLCGFTLFYFMLFVFFATGNNRVLPYKFFWQV